MAQISKECFYTKDHEWVRKTDDVARVRVGISDFAQASLGDVTFVELPEIGTLFERGSIVGTVESVKAASDIYAPLSGKISGVNSALLDDPSTLNTDPYGDGWLFELELTQETEFSSLLSPEAYEQVAH